MLVVLVNVRDAHKAINPAVSQVADRTLVLFNRVLRDNSPGRLSVHLLHLATLLSDPYARQGVLNDTDTLPVNHEEWGVGHTFAQKRQKPPLT